MCAESASDFDHVVERQHLALNELLKGNKQPLEDLYSGRGDVTLGNPFGPFVRGFGAVAETRRAASFYRDGEAIGFDRVAKHVTPDLARILETERYRSKVGGADELTPVSGRVTSIFRREDGVWKLVHRAHRVRRFARQVSPKVVAWRVRG